jgi:hypothetical protein
MGYFMQQGKQERIAIEISVDGYPVNLILARRPVITQF